MLSLEALRLGRKLLWAREVVAFPLEALRLCRKLLRAREFVAFPLEALRLGRKLMPAREVVAFPLEVPVPSRQVAAGSRGRCVSAGSPCAFTASCCWLARSLQFRWKSLCLHDKLLRAREVVAFPLEAPAPWQEVAAGSRAGDG